jgi:hypothetical protein
VSGLQGTQPGILSPFDLQGTYEATAIVERSLMGGYGGAETLNQFLLALPYVPGTATLRKEIAVDLLRYNRALRQTEEKRVGKITLLAQEMETIALVGGEAAYDRLEDKLLSIGIDDEKVTPIVIALYQAFDWLTDAYLKAYRAMGLCMEYIADAMGWDRYLIDDPEFAMYLSRLFHGAIKGDTKISAEERAIMQVIVLGNYARIDTREAVKTIRLGGQVLRWGYLSEIYDAYFLDRYEKANSEWSIQFQKITAEALPQLLASLWRPPQIIFQTTVKGTRPYSFPFFIDTEGSWETGKIRGTISLEPLEKFPAFVTDHGGAITGFFGPPGSGKTIALDAILAYAVMKRSSVVFVPVSDDTNQVNRCIIPLIPISNDPRDVTSRNVSNLKDWGVEITGIPRLTLNIITPETRHELQEAVLTKYDVVIEVANPEYFQIDSGQMKVILDKLKEHGEFPEFEHRFDGKTMGVINVRRLDTTIPKRRMTFVDAQIGRRILDIIDKWRYHNMNMPLRIQVDEIADLAPSVVKTSGGQDLLSLGVTIEKILRRHRRKDMPFDFASQRPVQIINELRDSMTNVLFRDLSTALKAEQSQLEFLAGALQVEREETLEAMKNIMKRGHLRGNHLMFWYNREARAVNLVQAVPPPFAVEVRGLQEEDHYKIWQRKFNGPKDLFRSVDNVEVLFTVDDTASDMDDVQKGKEKDEDFDIGSL